MAPLNSALNRFGAAINTAAGQRCSCPAGEFNASGALVQIPGIIRDYQAVQGVLQQIKGELPTFTSDIQAVVVEDEQEMADLAGAYRGYQGNNAAEVTDGLLALSNAQRAAAATVTRLRSDLGLPPPKA